MPDNIKSIIKRDDALKNPDHDHNSSKEMIFEDECLQ